MGRVGFVGIGIMGSRMAARLMDAGHDLTIYNRTASKCSPLADKGAVVAASPAEAAAGADVVFTNMADGAALRAVVLGEDGVIEADPPPKLLVDMGTVAPAESAEIAAAAAAKGIGYLRSPVSGSTVLAEAGKLTILASGDKAVYDAADPYLSVIGETRYHVGGGEDARYLKLVLNMMVSTQVQILAEGLVLGESAGLDWKGMLEVIGNSVVGSPLVKYKSGPLGDRNYAPAFLLGLMIKDLDLALAAAAENGVELPTTKAVREFYQQAADAGHAEQDFSAVTLELERMAGI
ncbi:MAG: NAD(P)-dependent oxidoreductase [Actinobacteria bacterium]|nr:NAD(P)-dependent oxidoreductase [Actinomycetota bacterium]